MLLKLTFRCRNEQAFQVARETKENQENVQEFIKICVAGPLNKWTSFSISKTENLGAACIGKLDFIIHSRTRHRLASQLLDADYRGVDKKTLYVVPPNRTHLLLIYRILEFGVFLEFLTILVLGGPIAV